MPVSANIASGSFASPIDDQSQPDEAMEQLTRSDTHERRTTSQSWKDTPYDTTCMRGAQGDCACAAAHRSPVLLMRSMSSVR